MPQSKKDLRKLKQKQAAEQGIVHEKKDPSKFTQAQCAKCKALFRTTKRNVEILHHQQAKHPESTFEECFPGETHD